MNYAEYDRGMRLHEALEEERMLIAMSVPAPCSAVACDKCGEKLSREETAEYRDSGFRECRDCGFNRRNS